MTLAPAIRLPVPASVTTPLIRPCAWANSTMIATSTRNRDVGNPAVTCGALKLPDPTPTRYANARHKSPRFTRHAMPATMATTSEISETQARFIAYRIATAAARASASTARARSNTAVSTSAMRRASATSWFSSASRMPGSVFTP